MIWSVFCLTNAELFENYRPHPDILKRALAGERIIDVVAAPNKQLYLILWQADELEKSAKSEIYPIDADVIKRMEKAFKELEEMENETTQPIAP